MDFSKANGYLDSTPVHDSGSRLAPSSPASTSHGETILALGAGVLALGAVFTFPAAAHGQASAELKREHVAPTSDRWPRRRDPASRACRTASRACRTGPLASAVPPPPAPATELPATNAPAKPSRRAQEPQQQATTQATSEVCVVTAPDGSCLIDSTECNVLGTPGNDTLNGTFNPDVICGLGGDDLLNGDPGDTLVGGPGEDELTVRGEDGTEPGGNPDSCKVDGDKIDKDMYGHCHQVNSFRDAELRTKRRMYGPPGGGGGGIIPGEGVSGGVVSETTGAGQVYVALNRYLQAGKEGAASATKAIAEILDSAVNYVQGELRFIVRCSYEGDGRVELTAEDKSGKRVKLGSADFHCADEGDDSVVTVEISAAGKRLFDAATRVRVDARVTDPELAKQPRDSRQTLVSRSMRRRARARVLVLQGAQRGLQGRGRARGPDHRDRLDAARSRADQSVRQRGCDRERASRRRRTRAPPRSPSGCESDARRRWRGDRLHGRGRVRPRDGLRASVPRLQQARRGDGYLLQRRDDPPRPNGVLQTPARGVRRPSLAPGGPGRGGRQARQAPGDRSRRSDRRRPVGTRERRLSRTPPPRSTSWRRARTSSLPASECSSGGKRGCTRAP